MGASHGLRKDQKLVRFPESPNLPSLALAPSMRRPAWPLQAAPSHSQSSEASGSSVTELAALQVLQELSGVQGFGHQGLCFVLHVRWGPCTSMMQTGSVWKTDERERERKRGLARAAVGGFMLFAEPLAISSSVGNVHTLGVSVSTCGCTAHKGEPRTIGTRAEDCS